MPSIHAYNPDIVKVRLQTTTQYSNALDAATKIWKNEGPLAFYKGTLTPLVGIGACVSLQTDQPDTLSRLQLTNPRYPSNSAPSTTPAAPSKPAMPTPTQQTPTSATASTTSPVPSPASPTPSSQARSSTSASGCKRNPTVPPACTVGRSTASASCPRTRACCAASIAASW